MTHKLKKTIQAVEAGISLSPAMKQAGYKPGYYKNPQQLKRTDAWREYWNEKFSDERMANVADEALSATKWNDFTGEREADHATRHKYWRDIMGYKHEKLENTGNIGQQFNIMMNSDGYIPTNNVLNAKPTKLTYKSKQAKR